MGRSNKICSAADAIGLIKSGSKIMIGGFGNAGNPEEMIDLLIKSDLKALTIISNDLGSPGVGLGKLLENNNIKALIGNYYNWNPEVALAYNEKIIDVTLIPQGTFAEAIRAAGVGIPGFYTPTSQGTDLGKGKETKEDRKSVV